MNAPANIRLIEQVSAQLRDMLGEDFDPDVFWDTLDGETDALDLIGHLVKQRVETDAQAAATKDVSALYQTRAGRLTDRSKALTKSIGLILDATGEKKVAHDLATVSRTKPRTSVNIFDETVIPSQLLKVVKSPDRTEIKKQLEAGEAVPGAELVAGEPGVTVRIK